MVMEMGSICMYPKNVKDIKNSMATNATNTYLSERDFRFCCGFLNMRTTTYPLLSLQLGEAYKQSETKTAPADSKSLAFCTALWICPAKANRCSKRVLYIFLPCSNTYIILPPFLSFIISKRLVLCKVLPLLFSRSVAGLSNRMDSKHEGRKAAERPHREFIGATVMDSGLGGEVIQGAKTFLILAVAALNFAIAS